MPKLRGQHEARDKPVQAAASYFTTLYQYHFRIESQKFRERRQHTFNAHQFHSTPPVASSKSVAVQMHVHKENSHILHEIPRQTQLLLIKWALFYIQETAIQSAAVTAVAELEPDILYTCIARMRIA
jgi:hypothetical protein